MVVLGRMRVTVTGATGSLGLASAHMLIQAGHSVRAFVRSPEAFSRLSKDERIEVVEGDLLDRGAVAAAMEETDAVLHCVAFPLQDFNLSFDAARFVLEGLGPRSHMICPSNSWVYGPPQTSRVGPDHPKESPARLGMLRADLEKAILAHGGTVVHLPDVFGPGVFRGWTHAFFQRALAGRRVWRPGDLDRPLELLFIDDAARALIAPLTRGRKGSEYTAGSPGPITARELAALISKAAAQQVDLRSLPIRVWRALTRLQAERRPLRDLSYLFECSTLFDGSVMRRELGWTPEIGYAEGVRRTVRWLQTREGAPG